MKKSYCIILFSILLIFCRSSHSVTNEDDVYIINNTVTYSGSALETYKSEIEADMLEDGLPSPYSSANSARNAGSVESITVYEFDNLFDLKSSSLPDWVIEEELEEHDFDLETDDTTLQEFILNEVIIIDPYLVSLVYEDQGSTRARGICSKKKKNKTKNFGKSQSISKDINQDIKLSGLIGIKGSAKYQKRSRCGIPYKYSYKGIDMEFSLDFDKLEGYFSEYDGDSLNTNLLLARLNLYDLTLYEKKFDWDAWAGPIYIKGDHNISLKFLVDLLLSLDVKFNRGFYLEGGISYKLVCAKSDCSVSDAISTLNATPKHTEAKGSVSLTASVTPKFSLINENKISVMFVKVLEVDTEISIAMPITLFSYYGNDCSSTENYLAKGTLFYMDLLFYGKVEFDPIFHSGKKININAFGKSKTIDVDEYLANKVGGLISGSKVAYRNLFFSQLDGHNMFIPQISIDGSVSSADRVSGNLMLPNCLPSDLKVRDAEFEVNYGDGVVVTTSSNFDHIYTSGSNQSEVNFSLKKIGYITIDENNSGTLFWKQSWNIIAGKTPFEYILPALNLIILD